MFLQCLSLFETGIEMINFKKVELSDKKWIDPLLAAADMGGSHHNFTNIFAWSGIYQHVVARINDYLAVMVTAEDNKKYYFYPAGTGDLKQVIELLLADAAERGHEFAFLGLSPENTNVLNTLFPGSFEYKTNIDSYDYVYLLDKLINLPGKKLQAKRNHINRFKKEYNWSFEQIGPSNLDECREMNLKWCIAHDCNDDEMLAKEKCAVEICFDHFSELGLDGGLLRCDGSIIAYTMGEVLNSTAYVTHIEKAFSDFHGSYQMINHEFALYIKQKYPQIIYVNREEDMGFDGLRKAKQSYHPDIMEEKYLAKLIKK